MPAKASPYSTAIFPFQEAVFLYNTFMSVDYDEASGEGEDGEEDESWIDWDAERKQPNLEDPDATHTMRKLWYAIDTIPGDVVKDETGWPVVFVIDEDGETKKMYLTHVYWPKGRSEYDYEVQVAEICAGIMGNVQKLNVCEVIFPGHRTPAVMEFTQGSPLKPVSDSPDMRPKSIIKKIWRSIRRILRG